MAPAGRGPGAEFGPAGVDRALPLGGAVALLTALACGCGRPAGARASLEAADRAWADRAAVRVGNRADTTRVEAAIRLYRQACGARAADGAGEGGDGLVEAHWKLLRALHYLVEFTRAPEARKQEAIDEAVTLARSAVRQFGEGAGSDHDRARVYFWAAIAWGARGQQVGLITLVREGVAGRLHEYGRRAAALDPGLERGGAYRLLSRLHAELPRVPLLSGWVDREQVLPLAEKAFATDPGDPGNALVLALAIRERAATREAEARELLDRACHSAPRPELLVEDLAIRRKACARLAAAGQTDGGRPSSRGRADAEGRSDR